jgi:hypothetical protein
MQKNLYNAATLATDNSGTPLLKQPVTWLKMSYNGGADKDFFRTSRQFFQTHFGGL